MLSQSRRDVFRPASPVMCVLLFNRYSALLMMVLWATCASSAPAALPEGFPQIEVGQKVRGETAIAVLGNRLPELAQFYRMTAAQLEALLRKDRALWVNEHGQLFYVCDWGQIPDEGIEQQQLIPELTVIPPEQTFLLHSR